MNTCKQCQNIFSVTDEDRAFYTKIKVPEPTLCPHCRAQRRLSWRNERKLYLNKSALSGKKLVSVISPDKPIKVYGVEEWWSDTYNPLDYARDIDFNRQFFEQFSELLRDVPHMNMIGSNNENCGYCHLIANCKHCYMIIESSNNEDCYYGYWLQKCLSSCDTSYSHECSYTYEIDNCYNCYDLKWSFDCNNSSDSYFLKSCIGVKKSFACINLQQKEYCIFNEQKTKEEYEAFIDSIDFESYKTIENLKKKFKKFVLKYPHKYAQITNSENCTGDYIMNSQNCKESYHAHDAEFCKYAEHVWRNSRYNMDVSTAGRNAEWIYESINTGISSNNVKFAVQNWTCSNMQYCYESFNSSNNFGCVGLKHNEYCILNKQYSKKEYFKLREKIIEYMKSTNEYGEFFPASLSPFGYNETVANEQYPLTKEESIKSNFRWSDYKPPNPDVKKTIPANKLPDSNQDIPDDILNWAIKCQVSGKPFRIIREELEFYRKYKIPIPRKHPDIRHAERIGTRNSNTLSIQKCAKCNANINTTFPAGNKKIVYCKKCYTQEIY